MQTAIPVNSRRPTSKSRFATAGPPGRGRELHPGAVLAANGTPTWRRYHPPVPGPPPASGLDGVGRRTKLVRGHMRHHGGLAGSICNMPSRSVQPSCRSHGMATRRRGDRDILTSPLAHARACSTAWRGRGSEGCTDSRKATAAPRAGGSPQGQEPMVGVRKASPRGGWL